MMGFATIGNTGDCLVDLPLVDVGQAATQLGVVQLRSAVMYRSATWAISTSRLRYPRRPSYVDLRSVSEVHDLPVRPAAVGKYINLPVAGGVWDKTDIRPIRERTYEDMVPSAILAVKAVVKMAPPSLREPIVVACSAGKDRTGLTLGLLLSCLGADLPSIALMQDAALSTLRNQIDTTRKLWQLHGWSTVDLERRLAPNGISIAEVVRAASPPSGTPESWASLLNVSNKDILSWRRAVWRT